LGQGLNATAPENPMAGRIAFGKNSKGSSLVD
jgi:hypothetical protein